MQRTYWAPKAAHLMFGFPFSGRTPLQLLTRPSFYSVRFNDGESFFIGNQFNIPFTPAFDSFALPVGRVSEESLADSSPTDRLTTLCYGPVTDLTLQQASQICPSLPGHWSSRHNHRIMIEATMNSFDLSPYDLATKLYGRVGLPGRSDSLVETVIGESVTDWEDQQQFAGKRLIDLIGFYLMVEPERQLPIGTGVAMPREMIPPEQRMFLL